MVFAVFGKFVVRSIDERRGLIVDENEILPYSSESNEDASGIPLTSARAGR